MPDKKVDKLNDSLNGIVDLQKSLNGFGDLFQSVDQAQQSNNVIVNTVDTVTSGNSSPEK